MANRGRPRKNYTYPKALVKRANERLRKLEAFDDKSGSTHRQFFYKNPATDEKGRFLEGRFDFAGMSRAYRRIEEYARRDGTENQPQIYRIVPITYGGKEYESIRFITPSEYKKLNREQQAYFERMVNQFLNDQTSTKIGVEQAYIDAYNTFRKNNKQFQNLSFENYMSTWKTYNDMIKADEENHYGYGLIKRLIHDGNFMPEALESLTADQANKAMKYMNDVSAQTTNGHGGKFMIDHTPPMRTSMSGVKFRGVNGRGR